MISSFFTRSAVLARFGGDLAFAVECGQALADELPAMLRAIRAAMQQRSAEQLLRAAHTLKGALSNFVLDGPTATAIKLEGVARDARLDDAPPLVKTLEDEVAMLMAGLRELAADSDIDV
jgi:HPt (histidine-containing phosphotransfer) domain-containing protein